MNPYPPVVSYYQGPADDAPAPEIRQLRFKFTGNAQEFFRIWIVNTLLTILTLGIYSAWAKVRTKQYFYRNTWLDGTSFEYLANPLAVLKGRILAAVVLVLVFGSQQYSLPLYVGLVILLVLATPWVLVKALAFNARNSSYRNIRFAFTGNTGEAAGLYLGMVLLHVVSCGAAYPYVQWRMTSFALTRHLFGDLRPAWMTRAGQYYKAYLIALALTFPGYALLVGGLFAGKGFDEPAAMQAAMVPVLALFYAYLLIPGSFLRARLANLLYGGTQLGPHWFESKQSGKELFKLYIVNLVAIVLSLGLLIPWAKIRLARYRADSLTLHASGPLVSERMLDEDANAVGEGLSDLGDFDVGVGV